MRCTPDDQAGSSGRRTVNQNNIIFDSESFAWLTRLQWSSLSFTSHRFHFFPAFLGLSVKTEGRTNRWTNRCSKNNPAIASRTTQPTCSQQKSLKMGRVGFADHFSRLVSWKVCGLSSTPKPTLTHTLQWKAKYSYIIIIFTMLVSVAQKYLPDLTCWSLGPQKPWNASYLSHVSGDYTWGWGGGSFQSWSSITGEGTWSRWNDEIW